MEILHTCFILHESLIFKLSIALFYETLHKHWPEKRKKKKSGASRRGFLNFNTLPVICLEPSYIQQHNKTE